MPRLLHSLALAALVCAAMLKLDAGLAGLRADEVSDCTKGSGDTRILGCSAIIMSGRIAGKRIGRKDLAIIHNNRGNAYNNRGIAYRNKRDYDFAMTDYAKAIELSPRYASAYNNRAWAYYKWGLASKALADANKAIELDPKYPHSYDTRGYIYEALNLKDAAIADFRKALALDPSNWARKGPLKRLGARP